MSGSLLSHSKVTADGAAPSRWAVFLHGVFGMGLNFRTIVKALVDERPAWGALLVDLRGHGANTPAEPPHTLASAAGDVERLVRGLELHAPVLVGHSLGGKTVLAYAKQFPGALRAVVLDSMPGARPAEAATGLSRNVLHFLEGLPATMPTRDTFTSAARSAGFTAAVVEWLAMNVRRTADGSGYALRLDLKAIRALLVDYYHQDYWDVVEDASYVEELDLVIAGASAHYTEADRERAEQAARSRNGMTVQIVEGAGHWLHVDAPDAIRALLRRSLDGVAAA